MRAIRQSDIEIAKAEVSILRSLGMEPDPEALLLSQLEHPPVQEVLIPGPVVEINGQAVEVENVTADEGLVSGSFAQGDKTAGAGKDDIDISLILPATEDTTMMHLRMANLHGEAQDVVGTMELSQIDDHYVTLGESLGKHAKTDTPSPYILWPLPQTRAPAETAGGGAEAANVPAQYMPEELVHRVLASPNPGRTIFRVGRGEGSVALDAAVKQSKTQGYAPGEDETGSVEVQVAAMTKRIKELTEHLKERKHDYNAQRSLLAMVGRRKRMLSYLKKTDIDRYRSLIERLGLRR